MWTIPPLQQLLLCSWSIKPCGSLITDTCCFPSSPPLLTKEKRPRQQQPYYDDARVHPSSRCQILTQTQSQKTLGICWRPRQGGRGKWLCSEASCSGTFSEAPGWWHWEVVKEGVIGVVKPQGSERKCKQVRDISCACLHFSHHPGTDKNCYSLVFTHLWTSDSLQLRGGLVK